MGNGLAAFRLTLAVVWLSLAAMPVAAACRDSQVQVRTPAGSEVRFTVEVADDSAERARGLMHRPSMPSAAGMLFVYPKAGPAAFWMRNTLIPLDMVFADATGTVVHVHANAVPLDETRISGGQGVQFVLEINGGLAAAMGIAPGALMRHPAIPASVAAWPCE